VAPWIDPQSLLPPDRERPRYIIPAHTPFMLEADVSKSGDTSGLSYTWEQFDFGPEQTGKLKDDGQGPIFRSFAPHAEVQQSFPHLAAVLGDEPLGNGEVYPATTRKLSFRLTVRDNAGMSQPLGVGPQTASANMYLDVRDTDSAFAVTEPVSAVSWKAGSVQGVSWNVAGTDRAPIGCTRVKLDLSVDGGYTYLPEPLRESVLNVGMVNVTVPKVSTQKARIRVACLNNVFFAVTPVNFTIEE
jgi:hypothetical protein